MIKILKKVFIYKLLEKDKEDLVFRTKRAIAKDRSSTSKA